MLKTQRKCVMFVDDAAYRFEMYYANSVWWNRHGIQPVFQVLRGNVFRSLFRLLRYRPTVIVINKRSVQTVVFAGLGKMLRADIVFWQHGIFDYDVGIGPVARLMPRKMKTIMAFSDYDARMLKKDFPHTTRHRVIWHYDMARIAESHRNDNDLAVVLYIGQVNFAPQLEALTGSRAFSGEAISTVDPNAQFEFELFINEVKKRGTIRLYLKKHPVDRSSYLDCLSDGDKVRLAKQKEYIKADLIVFHYSTLAIPYLQADIPGLQIDSGLQIRSMDFSRFGNVRYVHSAIEMTKHAFETKRSCGCWPSIRVELSDVLLEEIQR